MRFRRKIAQVAYAQTAASLANDSIRMVRLARSEVERAQAQLARVVYVASLCVVSRAEIARAANRSVEEIDAMIEATKSARGLS